MYQLACNVRSGKSPRRSGLTLIELLIAVTLTLVIIAVMVRAFKLTSDEIGVGRARMDMHNQLRTVTETLRRDLQLATCLPRPRGLNDERTGYFEYVEGPEFDRDHLNQNTNSFLGDHDDALTLTIRSIDKPFRGRYNGGFVESNLAEVVWFVVHTGPDTYDGQFRLYRRVLLIRPDLGVQGRIPNPPPPAGFDDPNDQAAYYFETNDVSARIEGTDMVFNSLSDLANRSNRYCHKNLNLVTDFPYELQNGYGLPGAQFDWLNSRVYGFDEVGDGTGVYNADREGEDLMLSGCVGFDIKVFSPNAPVFTSEVTDGTPLRPTPPYLPATFAPIDQIIEFGDPGFDDLYTTYSPTTFPVTFPQAGGFVDLGVNPIIRQDLPMLDIPRPYQGNGEDAWFIVAPYPMEYAPPGTRPYNWSASTYCTWFAGYESDGINQDGDLITDEGANGVDDDGANGIDDNAERETQPPYPYPIRSLQISVRMIETKTNQILQKTIKESFVPN